MRTANVMALAGVAALALIGVFGAIFLHTFGTSFVIAANSSTGLPASIAASPTYFLLLSASVGYTLVAVLLVLTYAVYWPLNTYCNFMQQTRIFFAWAFDGSVPRRDYQDLTIPLTDRVADSHVGCLNRHPLLGGELVEFPRSNCVCHASGDYHHDARWTFGGDRSVAST